MKMAGMERDIGADGVSRVVPAALLRDVVRYFRPVRVVLFGSGGRGEAGADSDLDLAVILPDDAPAALLHWRAVNEARRGHDLAVDIVPFRLSAFAAAAEDVGSLPWIIAREGRVIWQQGSSQHIPIKPPPPHSPTTPKDRMGAGRRAFPHSSF